jgi:hypothetical protein
MMRCHYGSQQINSILIVVAGLLLVTASGGCGLHRAYCVSGGGCGPCEGDVLMADPCGCDAGACCGSCDTGACCGGCDAGACCGDVYPGTCGACSVGSPGGLSGFCLPLMCTKLACGSGCGGVYWNEWICDPPECCDPCDDYGCWVGPQPCHHPGGVLTGACRRVKQAVVGVIHLGLYGYRPGCYGPCGGGCGGCGACGDCGFEECCGCSDCGDCGCGPVSCDSGCVDGCTGACASSTVAPIPLAAQEHRDTRVARPARPPRRMITR